MLSRHLANGCVLKCGCTSLVLFLNLPCLGTIICYINTIGIVPVYTCKVCDVLVASCATTPNVHETKWMPHVKRPCDVAYSSSSQYCAGRRLTLHIRTLND